MGKEKTESYYKILGTTAKIGNSRIKEKYIQAVKKHPPETDPEGFEKVRQAYETLKDPQKRKQYDLFRKYGTNVEDLLEEGLQVLHQEEYQKAADLLKQASEISPNDPSVATALMMLAVANDDLAEMEHQFNRTLEAFSDSNIEEIATLYSMQTKALIDYGYVDEALEALERGKEVHPDVAPLLDIPYISVCMEMGLVEEAWATMNRSIPNPEEETFDDIYIFILWAEIMINLEKWESKSKVQSRFRKFIKNLSDEEERDMAYDILFDQFEELYDFGDFRSAEFFIDLVKVLAGHADPEIKKMQKDTQTLARIQKEISRLEKDEYAFPLLFLHAYEWFYEDIIAADQLSMMLNMLPADIIDELKQEKEEYAAGIIRLSKKYPALYRHYKERWDDLFTELTAGFNRQLRRDLRKVR